MAHAGKRDAELALCNLARHAGVELDPRDVAVELGSHPAYPSLLAVVHTLDALGLSHVAAAADTDALAELAPAIIHTTAGLLVVESMSDVSATIVDADGRRSLGRDELDGLHTGPVIVLDGEHRTTHLRERFVEARTRRERTRRLAWLAGLAWFIGLAALAWTEGLVALGLVGLGAIGLVATLALVGVEQGVDGLLGQKLCDTRESGRGCDAVLHSPLGAIAGVRVSELGLGYFVVQQVGAAVALATTSGLTALAAAAVLVVPVSLISIAYQAFVVRAWCRLCLLVQLVVLGQAALAAFMLRAGASFDPRAVVAMAALAAATILAGIAARRHLLFAANQAAIEAELLRLRRAPQRIAGLLHTAALVELDALSGDVVRAPDAAFTIGLVISLDCEGCRAAFVQLDDLLARFPERVGARVRFSAKAEDERAQAIRATVVDRALADNHEGAWACLRAHFCDEPLSSASAPDEGIRRALEAQATWCTRAGIMVTPTRVVGGRLLDPSVSIADLGHFIALQPRG